jgi:DNA-directed RNA polymerase omega subunit
MIGHGIRSPIILQRTTNCCIINKGHNKMKITDSRGSKIDNEKCVINVGHNRFNLVLIAAARAREIKRQHKESEKREHIFPIITALEEIEAGSVGAEYIRKVR